MRVIAKIEFSWDNIRFKRGLEYDIPNTEKFKEFVKVGYLKEVTEKVETSEKEDKTERKTKEYKGSKKTK